MVAAVWSTTSTTTPSPFSAALELVGGAFDDEATVVDDREPVGEMVRLVEVVRREQDRQLFDRSQAGDLVPHLRSGLGVEAGRGLVEEEHGWPGDQAHGDVELAQHAAAVGLGEAVGRVRELEAVQQLGGPGSRLGAGHPVDARRQENALAAGHHRRRARLLRDQSDGPTDRVGVAGDVVAGDDRAAVVRPGQRREDLHRRRLAGAVRSEQAEHLALADGQGETVESLDGRLTAACRIRLDEVGGLDGEMRWTAW